MPEGRELPNTDTKSRIEVEKRESKVNFVDLTEHVVEPQPEPRMVQRKVNPFLEMKIAQRKINPFLEMKRPVFASKVGTSSASSSRPMVTSISTSRPKAIAEPVNADKKKMRRSVSGKIAKKSVEVQTTKTENFNHGVQVRFDNHIYDAVLPVTLENRYDLLFKFEALKVDFADLKTAKDSVEKSRADILKELVDTQRVLEKTQCDRVIANQNHVDAEEKLIESNKALLKMKEQLDNFRLQRDAQSAKSRGFDERNKFFEARVHDLEMDEVMRRSNECRVCEQSIYYIYEGLLGKLSASRGSHGSVFFRTLVIFMPLCSTVPNILFTYSLYLTRKISSKRSAAKLS